MPTRSLREAFFRRLIQRFLPNWEDIESILSFFGKIYDLIEPLMPDFQNAEEVRQKLLWLIGPLNAIADLTPTQIDDWLVKHLQKIADNQELWSLLYGILVDIVGGEEPLSPGNPRIKSLAKAANIEQVEAFRIVEALTRIIDASPEASSPTSENND